MCKLEKSKENKANDDDDVISYVQSNTTTMQTQVAFVDAECPVPSMFSLMSVMLNFPAYIGKFVDIYH